MKRMDSVGFKTKRSVYEIDKESDRKARAVIKDLGLRDKQQVNSEDLYRLVKVIYGSACEVVLADLLDSVHLKTVYVIDLKAKRDESDLIRAEKE
jgi:hypothetical protein